MPPICVPVRLCYMILQAWVRAHLVSAQKASLVLQRLLGALIENVFF